MIRTVHDNYMNCTMAVPGPRIVACMQGKVGLGLEVLTALAEEGSALERRRRNEVLPVLVRRSAEVLALVSAATTGRLGQGNPAAVCCAHYSALLRFAGLHVDKIRKVAEAY